MRITLKNIAEEAGVSQMTVSRILNGKADGQVSDAVRRRVAEAAERRGYKPGRKRGMSVPEASSSRKITFLIPCPGYLECHPENIGKDSILPILQETAREFGGVIEVLPISRFNSPYTITWEWLKHLGPGDLVLAGGPWEIVAAIELQRRGCKVAILMEELFWRTIYAPQLKKMAVFTARRVDAFARLTKYLLLSGHKKIALMVFLDYMFEPEYPPIKGYEYMLNLSGNSYRHLIPIQDTYEEMVAAVSKAYKNKPFDALIYQQRGAYVFPSALNLNESLHLLSNVEVVITGQCCSDAFKDSRTGILSPKERMHKDAIRMLLSDRFNVGERFYDYDFFNIPADRVHLIPQKTEGKVSNIFHTKEMSSKFNKKEVS